NILPVGLFLYLFSKYDVDRKISGWLERYRPNGLQGLISTYTKTKAAYAETQLVCGLKDKDPIVRQAATIAFSRHKRIHDREALVQALKDRDGRVRNAAAKTLDSAGWQPSRDEAGAYYWIERRAWDKCEEIGAPAVSPLVAILRNKDANLRQAAADTLDKIGWQPAGDEERSFYWIAKNSWERCAQIGAPAVEPLVAALDDQPTNIRQGAIQSLGWIGDPLVVERLIPILNDRKQGLRQEIIEAMSKIGDASQGSEYVDGCFEFPFTENEETRDWQTIPELARIPQSSQSSVNEALKLLEEAFQNYADHDFVYVWRGYLLEQTGKPENARLTYLEGLQKARSKVNLCDALGMYEFRARYLEGCVSWWIRACVLQLSAGKMDCVQPFLRLACLSDGLKLPQCHLLLMAQVEKIENIRLDAQGIRECTLLAREQGSEAICQAVSRLCAKLIGSTNASNIGST
ncbi:MAG: HEAT repeat domain-containing protein, partial [Anaerolineales bacterium]|nr:HEAT repeat domain-containing protein [Anaerolineales bacterium]